MPLSDAEIDALISAPKRITEPPKRDMTDDGGHLRNDFKCESIGGDHRFRVFMRQNKTFPDAFSVGLVCVLPEGGEVILLRCNGPHGVVSDPLSQDAGRAHYDFHIHRATAENLDNGRRAEAGADATTEYGTFDDALAYFVQRCAISNAEAQFSALANPTLF